MKGDQSLVTSFLDVPADVRNAIYQLLPFSVVIRYGSISGFVLHLIHAAETFKGDHPKFFPFTPLVVPGCHFFTGFMFDEILDCFGLSNR